jgi:hypothetical protein
LKVYYDSRRPQPGLFCWTYGTNYITKPKVKLEEDLIRHMVIEYYQDTPGRTSVKITVKYVLCSDNRKYWRKEFFHFLQGAS